MSPFEALVDLVATLRGPDGCPWDKAQDPRSLRPYVLEEAHEVVAALDAGDLGELKGELGDVLFQVVLLSQMAKEAGEWDIEAVCRAITEKMIHRHPHVFDPEHEEEDPGSVAAWEARKAQDRKAGESMLDSIPAGLPALLAAYRMGEKVSRVGFDWPDLSGVRAKVDEELGELEAAIEGGVQEEIVHEYGDLLLAVANMGRFLKIGPEEALREASARFARRFRIVESLSEERGLSLHELDLAGLEALWSEAKK
jgi:MazG family protein